MQDQQLPADLPSLSPEPPSEVAAGSVPSTPVSQPVTSTSHAQGSVQAPAGAADNDLIEKEWVLKAKQIVEQTRDDPYKQQKAIEKFKADYMKKRYNKTIRVTDT